MTKDGVEVLIRSIRPEDGPLLIDLFHSLSPRSIYMRFFSPLKALTPEMVARFTQIDPEREIAWVALEKGPSGRIIGVCRLISVPECNRAEVVVVVGDPWQGKGIGARLIENCITIAKERGIKTLWGLVLPENTTVIGMARKYGFPLRWSPTSDAYELEIDLSSITLNGRMPKPL